MAGADGADGLGLGLSIVRAPGSRERHASVAFAIVSGATSSSIRAPSPFSSCFGSCIGTPFARMHRGYAIILSLSDRLAVGDALPRP
ncbi:hypothetical protein [Actinoplanes sp. NPDC051851]|uniref:hypothetical protein n=1 Tax=Actinoplanes sp. NPDC051851 TaxID=3154753 RepID=UPI00342581A9